MCASSFSSSDQLVFEKMISLGLIHQLHHVINDTQGITDITDFRMGILGVINSLIDYSHNVDTRVIDILHQ